MERGLTEHFQFMEALAIVLLVIPLKMLISQKGGIHNSILDLHQSQTNFNAFKVLEEETSKTQELQF